jgi:V8-like Glu-specific endopeptidase
MVNFSAPPKILAPVIAGVLVVWLALPVAPGVVYPKRGLASESTGYLQSEIGGDWYRGSGCVVQHPRLIFTAAHMIHDEGLWASRQRFARAHHSNSIPGVEDGIMPRGMRYWTSYASRVRKEGDSSRGAFERDFAVLYHSSRDFGPALGCWADGAEALVSGGRKRIVGYPARIDFTRESGRSYQHRTDWFTIEGRRNLGAYVLFDGVSTGGGNSGGPVFVEDGDQELVAGILVSGSRSTAGVRAIDDAALQLAQSALGGRSTRSINFRNTDRHLLPDGAKRFSRRTVTASGFNGSLQHLDFSVNIATPRRGDLEVYLRSPSGRVRWVAKQQGGSTRNLRQSGIGFSSTYRGQAADGRWQLYMRDAVKGNRATFRSFAVRITG